MRPITGLIIVLLGLADSLDITSMMSILMALIAFCLVWENVTSLRRDAKIWERWENTEYPQDRDDRIPVIGEGSDDSGHA